MGDTVDLIFHFHIGRAADAEYRQADVRAVVATATYGLFATAYGDGQSNPERFPQMLGELELLLAARYGRPIAIGRIAVVAWSAGYGAVRKLLLQPVKERIDAVILLDGLHTAYTGPRWSPKVDARDLEPFVAFARAAANGQKLMVISHTAIIPPGYASTTETADVLLQMLDVPRVPIADAEPNEGLVATSRADRGNFHVRAFAGDNKEVHVAQLRLVDDLLREYLAPRWAQR